MYIYIVTYWFIYGYVGVKLSKARQQWAIYREAIEDRIIGMPIIDVYWDSVIETHEKHEQSEFIVHGTYMVNNSQCSLTIVWLVWTF